MAELKASIETVGLLQPLVVRPDPDGTAAYRLVAGERRMRILKELGLDYPCVLITDLDEVSREEAELDENIKRADLTWQEKSDALARLHRLRQKQAIARGEVQSINETARETFGYQGASHLVNEALIIDKFKDRPEIANAKSANEAMSKIRKIMAQEFSVALAARTSSSDSPHTVITGDCRVELLKLEANLFDCIVTDPPYGIDMHKNSPMSNSNKGTVHDYDDTFAYAETIWKAIVEEGFRVCKPEAALYMFCDFSYFTYLEMLARTRGWTVWPRPIIWHKPAGGMLGDSMHGPRKTYETILFCYKGDKRTTGLFSDVIIENPTSSFDHAAAKPPTLYENLLKRSTLPGNSILDPCVGGGTFFSAANALKLRATGIEISPEYAATAKTKLRD